jgi:hypothetical protein
MFALIKKDLAESKINWKVALIFIPIAFFTYLFHEFGHWLGGELFGNKMILGLNYSTPKSGSFIKESHALWSAIGGPTFTILQALLFSIIVLITKSVYSYAVVYFAVFSRFFSIVFGSLISLQDELRISSILNLNKYIIAILVLIILFLILWRSSKVMKFNFKVVCYYSVVSTCAVLFVIAVNKILY